MMLWLRHVRLLPVVFGAVAAAAVVRLLVFSLIETDGARSTMTPLWVSMALVLPLILLFTTEDAWDRIAVRPVVHRRYTLVLLAVTVSAVLSFVFFPRNFPDFGSLATLRNILGLLGIGLLSLTVVPRWAGWIAPAVTGLLFMSFAVPWEPSSSETAWGALRMAGALVTPQGEPDLSWWVCLGFFVVGAVSYLRGWRIPDIAVALGQPGRWSRPPEGSGDFRRGLRRAMFLWGVVVGPLVIIVWALGVQLKYWGGSPYLLIELHVPVLLAVAMPVAFAGGVVAGQYRWRSSVVVWEELSGRPGRSVIWSSLRPLFARLTVGVVGALLLFVVVACGGALADGVDSGVVWRELRSSTWLIGVTAGAVIIAATIGYMAGNRIRGIWLPPVGFVGAAILGIVMLANLGVDEERTEITVTADSDDVVCEGQGPAVCAEKFNAGYIPAALSTVEKLYASSPFSDDLPQRVYVVDNGWYGEAVDGPVVGLSTERGITAPDSIGETNAKGFIVNSISEACVPAGTDPLKRTPYLLQGMDGIFDPNAGTVGDDAAKLRETLRTAEECFAS